ncbi:MAG: YCF48-related protein [Ignavibacteria bacterium]
MRKILTVIFVLALSTGSFPQYYKWEWQNPELNGNDINDVILPGAGNVLAFGNAGVSQVSVNGGLTWSIAYIDSFKRDIMGAYSIDNSSIVICGRAGLLMKTTNGGGSWEYLNSGTPEDLYDVEFVDADTGYAVGSKGTILKTKDGGNSWASSTYGASNIYKVRAVNATNIFIGVSSTTERILKSIDYGSSWVNITPGNITPVTTSTSSVYAICFLDAKIGFFGTANGNIFKTTDSGTVWTKKTNFVVGAVRDIEFISTAEGYAVDDQGNILITTDAGETWTERKVPLQKFYAVSCDSSAVYCAGVAAGIYKSTDKGVSWSPLMNYTT